MLFSLHLEVRECRVGPLIGVFNCGDVRLGHYRILPPHIYTLYFPETCNIDKKRTWYPIFFLAGGINVDSPLDFVQLRAKLTKLAAAQ